VVTLDYASAALTNISNPAFCIHGFFMIFNVNSDHFLKQHYPAELCSGEMLCSLGKDWILKYYLDDILRQRVKKSIISFFILLA
jgi:hypothetical protein